MPLAQADFRAVQLRFIDFRYLILVRYPTDQRVTETILRGETMMKLIFLTVTTALVFLSTSANAGGSRNHGYYGNSSSHSYSNSSRAYRHGNKRNHANYRHDGRNNQRHGHKQRRHHSKRGAYVLGGLLLGGALWHSLSNNNGSSSNYSNNNGYTPSPPTPQRSLLRDRYGNCFEIGSNQYGEEWRRELPSNQCNW
ncbi:MAG: hypothetical protein ACI8P9_000397 [Parasphingorhabdus sp.]|jgi:hypothetical protein